MKKRFAMIAAALTGALMISFAAVPVSAASNQVDEQYVVEEEGQTIVYIITYVEPDDVIREQRVTWYDANGTKYVHTYKAKPQQDVISCSVTWYDAARNKYVLDDSTKTVTVYESVK